MHPTALRPRAEPAGALLAARSQYRIPAIGFLPRWQDRSSLPAFSIALQGFVIRLQPPAPRRQFTLHLTLVINGIVPTIRLPGPAFCFDCATQRFLPR